MTRLAVQLPPRCLLSAILACSPPLAANASPREPVELERIEVREPRAWTPAHVLARERERLRGVAGGTNLIDLGPPGRRATLRDVLDGQPGIVVQDFFGGLDQPRINIRGSGIQSNPVNRGVQLLQDGLPLNEADGSFVIGLVELRNAAFVSVRRGANATTPAATTLGGEIDLHTASGADERGRLQLETGSFGRRGAQWAHGGASGAHPWRLSASADAYDGYRHHSDGERQSVQARLDWDPGEHLHHQLSVGWTRLAFHIPSVVPKARVTSDPRGVLGDQATPQDRLLNVYRRDPRREARQWRIADQLEWSGDAWQHTLGLWWQATDDLFNNTTVHTISDGATHGLQFAAHATRGSWQYRVAAARTGGQMTRDLYANDPLTGTRLQRFGHYALDAASADVLASVAWQATPAWQLQAASRWSQVQRNARAPITGAALDQQYTHASPRLGVIWQGEHALRLFANLSRSQEAPSWWEIVNSDVSPVQPGRTRTWLQRLRTQQADTLELGGDGEWNSDRHDSRWSLAVYRSQVNDELMAMLDGYGNRVGTYNYTGGTLHQGLEAGWEGQASLPRGDGIEWRLAWTYSDFRFRGGPYAGNQIAGIPRHLLSAEVIWAGSNGWRAGPSLRWLPRDTPTDHANTRASYQDAYALLGAKLEYAPPGQAWSAFLIGDNLADRRYASSYSIRHRAAPEQPGYLPGVGRNVSLGLRWQF
jgi:iron complex outermembrane receptor protein